jgi:hypothetical protein
MIGPTRIANGQTPAFAKKISVGVIMRATAQTNHAIIRQLFNPVPFTSSNDFSVRTSASQQFCEQAILSTSDFFTQSEHNALPQLEQIATASN